MPFTPSLQDVGSPTLPGQSPLDLLAGFPEPTISPEERTSLAGGFRPGAAEQFGGAQAAQTLSGLSQTGITSPWQAASAGLAVLTQAINVRNSLAREAAFDDALRSTLSAKKKTRESIAKALSDPKEPTEAKLQKAMMLSATDPDNQALKWIVGALERQQRAEQDRQERQQRAEQDRQLKRELAEMKQDTDREAMAVRQTIAEIKKQPQKVAYNSLVNLRKSLEQEVRSLERRVIRDSSVEGYKAPDNQSRLMKLDSYNRLLQETIESLFAGQGGTITGLPDQLPPSPTRPVAPLVAPAAKTLGRKSLPGLTITPKQ